MPSFDIVCEADLQEVDNAVNQAAKEMASRFDFRGSKSRVELQRADGVIKIEADDELKLRAIHGILESKFSRRSLDIRILDYQDPIEGSGQMIRQLVKLRQGLSKEEAKSIGKKIRETKLKVQSQIQDDQVRVTGKKIDDLQKIIAMLKESDLDLPLNYVNMRG